MAEIPTGGAGGTGGFASTGPQQPAEVAVGRAQSPKPVPGESAETSAPKGDGAEQGTHVSQDGLSKQAAAQVSTKDAGRALGAGGTSPAVETADDDQGAGVGRGGGTATKAAGAAAAVPVAGAAGQLMLLLMFINYLKGLGMALMALAMNLWNLAMAVLLGLGKAAVGIFMSVGGAISGAVGGAVSTVAAGAASFAAGGLVTVAVIATIVTGIASGSDLAMKDTSSTPCKVTATAALSKLPGSDGTVDQQTMANAKTIYSVLSAWGMPDENIAGIIGNWDAESGIDPTSVQGYFDSPQVMSDAKTSAATDTNNGIGLGQWTFGRNTNLRAYAGSLGKDWWSLNVQLGFMVSAAEGSDAGIVKDMIATSYGTPTAAALHFHDAWERSADTDAMKARRGVYAEKWMGLFSGWTKDQALANSILAQAGTTVTGANTARATSVRADCLSVGAGQVSAKPGGLTLDEATKLMALYKSEGEGFLDSRYGAGGPGDCGFGKADNCVGFDTYFMNKYTSFQQYAPGNGIDQAASIAKMTGKTLSKTPSVYSIASGPGTGAAGHVMVILGIQGDQAIIGEAACGTDGAGTRAYTRPLSTITDGAWEFVDVSDLITSQPATS